MIAEKTESDLVEEALQYISDRKYPDHCTDNRKRQIRKKAEKFVLRDDDVFYNPGNGKQMVKFIRSKADQRRIMKSCHVDTTSGHLGIKKTVARIKERFMWKGIWSDVKEMFGL